MVSPVLTKKRSHETEDKLPEPEARLTKRTNAAGLGAIAPPPSPTSLGRRTFQQLETEPTPFLLPDFRRPLKRTLYTNSPSKGFSSSPSSAFHAIKPRPPSEQEDEELIQLLRSASLTPLRMENRCYFPTPDLEQKDTPALPESPIRESSQPSPPPSTASDTLLFSPIHPALSPK